MPRKSHYFKFEDITIYQADVLRTRKVASSSVDLIITSPPYNVDIHYKSNQDNLFYSEYLQFTKKWLAKCYRIARDDGRICLNIPLDKNKGGQQAVYADITKIAKSVGWNYYWSIVWNEGNISRRTAWGSWMSASAPYVIAPVEMVVIFYKKYWKRNAKCSVEDITEQEYKDWTTGVWTFNGQTKKGAGGHPAPFPIELPRRCLKLFSFVGDTILDPFLGSGTTLIAAYQNKRKGVGIELDKSYCEIAIQRLQNEAKIYQQSLL